jgi:hypothetical protein
VIVIAVNPELVGRGGQPGFSAKQIILALVGFFPMLSGFVLASLGGRRHIGNWLITLFVVPEQQLKPTSVLLISIWFGLVTGLSKVFIQGVQRFVVKSVYLNPDVFWMTPVAELVIFTVLGLVFLLVASQLPRLITLRLPAFVFAFFGFSGVLFIFQPRLQMMAAVILAAGLAVQT